MSELIPQVEGHWLACMASLGGGGRITRIPGALVLTNPQVEGTFANAILLRGASAEAIPDTVDMGHAILGAAEREAALFLSPLAGAVESIEPALRAHGWRRHVTQSVLVRPLPAEEAAAPGIQVEAIGPERLAEWGRVLIEAYEVGAEQGEAIRDAWSSLMASPGENAWARFYLASTGNEPKGTALLWGRGEVAGLYCGAVLPEGRRQGVERATVVRRLQDAALLGARLAVVQTEADSPVEHLCANRLGFTRCYQRSVWLPNATLNICG